MTEIRQSFRRVASTPSLSVMAVVIMAVTFAANTTALGVVSSTRLRPLGVAFTNRFAALTLADPRTARPGFFSADDVRALEASPRPFSAVAMYSIGVYRVEANGVALDVGGEGVSPGYFKMLEVPVAMGRFFDHTDASSAVSSPVAVISYRLFKRLFAEDPRAIATTITVDARPVVVVGVAAAPFVGLQVDSGVDIFLPIAFARTLVGDTGRLRAPTLVVKMAPGVSLPEAGAEVIGRWPAIQAASVASLAEQPRPDRGVLQVALQPLRHGFSGVRTQWDATFTVILGLTLVLVLVCAANLMGLMLTRALARDHESAVELALGATYSRLIRGHLLDGMLLAIVAFVLAIPLFLWAANWLTVNLSFARTIPLQRPLVPDGRVWLAAAALAGLMASAIGLLPIVHLIRAAPTRRLVGVRGASRPFGFTARCVIGAQVAMCVVLLVGAGLLTGTLSNLRTSTRLNDAEQILFARLSRVPGDRAQLPWTYFGSLLDRLSAAPGVQAAAMSSTFPAYAVFVGEMRLDNFQADVFSPAGPVTRGLLEYVTPGFFTTLGLGKVRGRDFDWRDSETATPVAILTDSMARRLYPQTSPLGRSLYFVQGATGTALEVVGVAPDAPLGTLRAHDLEVVFRPMMQDVLRVQNPIAHVRFSGNAADVQDAYVRIVSAEGRHFVRGLFTLDDWFDGALLRERLMAFVATSLALLAAALAALGVYSAVSYSAAAREREVGVRIGLGATRRAIVSMILRDSLWPVAIGVAAGVPLALAAASLLRSQLYGVEPTNPVIVATACALLLLSGAAAALVPAARVSMIRVADVLRQV